MIDFRSYSELYHFGIKGMRWGIRRYQNPDGTLTPAGIKRYNKLHNKLIKESDKYYDSYKKSYGSEDKLGKVSDRLKVMKHFEKQKKLLNKIRIFDPNYNMHDIKSPSERLAIEKKVIHSANDFMKKYKDIPISDIHKILHYDTITRVNNINTQNMQNQAINDFMNTSISNMTFDHMHFMGHF